MHIEMPTETSVVTLCPPTVNSKTFYSSKTDSGYVEDQRSYKCCPETCTTLVRTIHGFVRNEITLNGTRLRSDENPTIYVETFAENRATPLRETRLPNVVRRAAAGWLVRCAPSISPVVV